MLPGVPLRRAFSLFAIWLLIIKSLTGEWDRHQDDNALTRRRGPHEDKTAEIAVDENLKALVASDDKRIRCPECCGQGHLVGCHAWI